MTTATALTLDRETVEAFLVEVDALAIFDSIRNEGKETWLESRLYGAIEQFERAAGLTAATDLHERAPVRARELWQEFVDETIDV
jgi:hypothetical protein